MSELRRCQYILVVLSLMIIVTSINVAIQSAPLDKLNQSNERLYQLKLKNEHIELALFKVFGNILLHYDDLNFHDQQIDDLHDDLLSTLDSDNKNILLELNQFKKALKAKQQSLEQFKTDIAIYKNSIHHLPGLFKRLGEDKAAGNKQLLQTLEKQLYLYMLSEIPLAEFNREFALVSEIQIDELQWQNLIRHITLVVDRHAELTRLLKMFGDHPANSQIERFHTYTVKLLNRQLLQQQFTIYAFYLAAAALLLFSIYTLFQYHRINQSIEAINHQQADKIKLATTELLAEKNQAEAASQSKSRFMTRMSHELRTPLNAILGFAQLQQLQQTKQAETKQLERTEQILLAGEHLLGLINDILDVVTLEQEQLDFDLQSCNLNQAIQQSIDMVQMEANSNDVKISCQALEEHQIVADDRRLRQVLINLLSNAAKYNKKGGSITVTTKQSNTQYTEITINDTGVGIAADELQSIFEPFTRLDYAELNEIQGAGIGLTLTRQLVNQMTGQIEVTSTVGEGTTFTLKFLTAKTSEPQQPITATATVPLPSPQQIVVVYIEDNQSSLNLIKDLFEVNYPQITLLTCTTAEQGIEIAKSQKPQLLLMDINLPKMNGKQAFSLLKAELALQKSHFYALTADATQENINSTLELGFDGYLTKPVDFTLLSQAIEQSLAAQTVE